jgi:hypothetical protein
MNDDNNTYSSFDLLDIFHKFFELEITIDKEKANRIVKLVCECQNNFVSGYFPMSEDSERKKCMKRELSKTQGENKGGDSYKYLPLETVLKIVENYDLWDLNIEMSEDSIGIDKISGRLAFIAKLVELAQK